MKVYIKAILLINMLVLTAPFAGDAFILNVLGGLSYPRGKYAEKWEPGIYVGTNLLFKVYKPYIAIGGRYGFNTFKFEYSPSRTYKIRYTETMGVLRLNIPFNSEAQFYFQLEPGFIKQKYTNGFEPYRDSEAPKKATIGWASGINLLQFTFQVSYKVFNDQAKYFSVTVGLNI